MDQNATIALIVVGLPSAAGAIGSAVWGFVKWSASRNLQHAEESAAATKATQVEHEKKIQDITARSVLDLNTVRSEMAEKAHKAELESQDLRTQLSNITASLGELKGALGGIRGAFEEGREKQAEFYRSELKRAEQEFRQELARHSHPDLPERVAKLEMAAAAKSRKK